MIKLIIFDLDGVLVDAKKIHFESLNKALGEYSSLSLFRKLNAVYVLNKNRDKKRAATFKADANWVKNA